MFDLDDRLLMRCTAAPSNESLVFRRHVRVAAPHAAGKNANIICFLPWRVPLGLASKSGHVGPSILACYELPNGTVASEPSVSAEAMRLITTDAENLVAELGLNPSKLVMVGLSLGSGPATYLANKFGCKLISVVSADRGDQMLWESPAVVATKEKAIAKGYDLSDFTDALQGLHPVENLSDVGSGSMFVTAAEDLYVPATRSQALIDAVKSERPCFKVVVSNEGHARTIASVMRELNQRSAA